MRFKKISFIILVGLLVAGCSGSSNYSISKTVTIVKDYPEDQNLESSEVTKITLPANKLYPQENEDKGTLFVPSFAYEKSFVDIKAEFFVEMDEVYYGKEDSEIRKSTTEFDGRNWHGEVETKEQGQMRMSGYKGDDWYKENPDDNTRPREKIIVIGKPKDGGNAITLEGVLYIKPKPVVKSVDYDRLIIGEPQTVKLSCDKKLDSVIAVMPDGSHKIFSEGRIEKSDTKEDVYSYSTELILPEFEQGFIKIYAYDRYGFEFEKDLCVNEPGGMRLFTISHYDNYIYEDGRDPYLADNFKMGFGTVNLDGSDFYEEFFIEVPPVEDEFFDSFKEFITDPGTKVNRLTGVTLRGVSPDKKWVAICGFHSYHFKNKDFMHEGYDVQKVSSEDFLIINTSTKEIRKIGTRHEIHYSSSYLKEIGPAYCIVKWDEDDKLYLVEQTKENKFFNKSQIVNYPSINNQMQVPWASARGVLLSLEDFSLNETDEVNPVAPWISFYDQTTGVIAYSSIDYDFGKHMYPGSFEQSATFGEIEFGQQGMIVSDLKGEHVWDIPKILTKEETDKYKLTNCDIIGSGYINGKLYAFIYAMFGDVTIDYSGEVYEEISDGPGVLINYYMINSITGELTKLFDDYESFFHNPQKCILASDPDKDLTYINTSIKLSNSIDDYGQCLAEVKEDGLVVPSIPLKRIIKGYIRKTGDRN